MKLGSVFFKKTKLVIPYWYPFFNYKSIDSSRAFSNYGQFVK